MAKTITRKTNLPKTGWSTSYVTAGGGDDGDIKAGSPISPRFIDAGDNTIVDRVTGRQWVKQPELIIPDGLRVDNIGQAKGVWAQNTSYAAGDIATKTSDYSAWVCLVAHTSINPSTYADSTPYDVGAVVYDDPNNTGDGTYYQCGTSHTSSGANIAADSGGGWTQVATDVGSLFSFDRTTNPSYWSQSIWAGDDGSGNLVPSQMQWSPDENASVSAVGSCLALTKSGKSDWYLPNITELLSIVDYSQVSPAINATFFPGTRTDNYYWTSTPYADVPAGYAWVVYFGYGYANHGFRYVDFYVRPVRQY